MNRSHLVTATGTRHGKWPRRQWSYARRLAGGRRHLACARGREALHDTGGTYEHNGLCISKAGDAGYLHDIGLRRVVSMRNVCTGGTAAWRMSRRAVTSRHALASCISQKRFYDGGRAPGVSEARFYEVHRKQQLALAERMQPRVAKAPLRERHPALARSPSSRVSGVVRKQAVSELSLDEERQKLENARAEEIERHRQKMELARRQRVEMMERLRRARQLRLHNGIHGSRRLLDDNFELLEIGRDQTHTLIRLVADRKRFAAELRQLEVRVGAAASLLTQPLADKMAIKRLMTARGRRSIQVLRWEATVDRYQQSLSDIRWEAHSRSAFLCGLAVKVLSFSSDYQTETSRYVARIHARLQSDIEQWNRQSQALHKLFLKIRPYLQAFKELALMNREALAYSIKTAESFMEFSETTIQSIYDETTDFNIRLRTFDTHSQLDYTLFKRTLQPFIEALTSSASAATLEFSRLLDDLRVDLRKHPRSPSRKDDLRQRRRAQCFKTLLQHATRRAAVVDDRDLVLDFHQYRLLRRLVQELQEGRITFRKIRFQWLFELDAIRLVSVESIVQELKSFDTYLQQRSARCGQAFKHRLPKYNALIAKAQDCLAQNMVLNHAVQIMCNLGLKTQSPDFVLRTGAFFALARDIQADLERMQNKPVRSSRAWKQRIEPHLASMRKGLLAMAGQIGDAQRELRRVQEARFAKTATAPAELPAAQLRFWELQQCRSTLHAIRESHAHGTGKLDLDIVGCSPSWLRKDRQADIIALQQYLNIILAPDFADGQKTKHYSNRQLSKYDEWLTRDFGVRPAGSPARQGRAAIRAKVAEASEAAENQPTLTAQKWNAAASTSGSQASSKKSAQPVQDKAPAQEKKPAAPPKRRRTLGEKFMSFFNLSRSLATPPESAQVESRPETAVQAAVKPAAVAHSQPPKAQQPDQSAQQSDPASASRSRKSDKAKALISNSAASDKQQQATRANKGTAAKPDATPKLAVQPKPQPKSEAKALHPPSPLNNATRPEFSTRRSRPIKSGLTPAGNKAARQLHTSARLYALAIREKGDKIVFMRVPCSLSERKKASEQSGIERASSAVGVVMARPAVESEAPENRSTQDVDQPHDKLVIQGSDAIVEDEAKAADAELSRKTACAASCALIQQTCMVSLEYSISEELLQTAIEKNSYAMPDFSYHFFINSNGSKIPLHYCKSFDTSERAAAMFKHETLLGFDLEWNPRVRANSTNIKDNVSVIQLASPTRIAIFQLALHKGDSIQSILPPALREILESDKIVKTGVGISSDCARLRKHLNVQSQGIIELSHLHNLVLDNFKNTANDGTLEISKKLTALSKQVNTHLYMSLHKGNVRTSTWHLPLRSDQCIYAANDAWAAVCLYLELERKRLDMDPVPERPPFVEKGLPIYGAPKTESELVKDVESESSESAACEDESDSELSDLSEEWQASADTSQASVSGTHSDLVESQLSDLSFHSALPDLPEHSSPTAPSALGTLAAATHWVASYTSSIRATRALRVGNHKLHAYTLWHHQRATLDRVATSLDRQNRPALVAMYILDAIELERLPFEADRTLELLLLVPAHKRRQYEVVLAAMRSEDL